MNDTITARQVFENLCTALEEKNWTFTRDDKTLSVRIIFDNDENTIDLRIFVDGQKQSITIISPMFKEIVRTKRTPVAIAVAAANKNIVQGCFNMDYAGGKLGFKMTNTYRSDKLPESDLFRYMVLVSYSTINKYFAKFHKVIWQDISFTEIKRTMVWE